MDPEVAAAMAPIAEAAAGTTPPPPGDWQARRVALDEMLATMTAAWSPPADVTVGKMLATAGGATPVGARLYRRGGGQPGSLAVYLHGGRMFLGSLDMYDPICRRYTHLSGVPLLSVDFRFAPEHPTRPRSRTATRPSPGQLS